MEENSQISFKQLVESNKDLVFHTAVSFVQNVEEAYNESGKRVSNLEKCIDVALEMAGNLHRMWDVLTFKDRVIMQRVVFPEGIQYDKKNNRCRTKEVNFFIRYFSHLSKDEAEIKSGDSNFIFEIPALVVPLGIEPSTHRL